MKIMVMNFNLANAHDEREHRCCSSRPFISPTYAFFMAYNAESGLEQSGRFVRPVYQMFLYSYCIFKRPDKMGIRQYPNIVFCEFSIKCML